MKGGRLWVLEAREGATPVKTPDKTTPAVGAFVPVLRVGRLSPESREQPRPWRGVPAEFSFAVPVVAAEHARL